MHHSTCNHDGPIVVTPGKRFRSLVSVCSDYVPVADVVTDSTAHVDNVIVVPRPKKRMKPTASPFFVSDDPSQFALVERVTCMLFAMRTT